MVFEHVRENLPSDPGSANTTLLILDDVSSLEWMGVPSADVHRFLRALRALCLKVLVHFILFAERTSFVERAIFRLERRSWSAIIWLRQPRPS
jgi:hypothetical protein